MKVPFLDLRVTDPNEKQQLLAAVESVLDHGRMRGRNQVKVRAMILIHSDSLLLLTNASLTR